MTIIGNVRVGGKNPVRIMSILNTSPESFYKKSDVNEKIISLVKGKIVFVIGSGPSLSTAVPKLKKFQKINKNCCR